MQHVRDIHSLQLKGCALTIGAFDGVHIGHQALISAMVSDAHARDLPSVVLTFYPHPSVVLHHRSPSFYITLPDEKAELMGELGVDYVVTQQFDHALSRIPARDYLNILHQQLALKSLWIGEDFTLGRDRTGDRSFIESVSSEYSFDVNVFPAFEMEGMPVRSSVVRQALRDGDVARVARYLGRIYSLPGEVVRGVGRGRQLGIPTANLHIQEERAYPGSGVYAGTVDYAGERWPAVTNIGVRPTFENEPAQPTIETHLLDFNGDLYGKKIRVGFVQRLRAEQRFDSPEDLIAQIEDDIQRARLILEPTLEGENV
jgi:riboflavin kinase/FMN adenylyltransferase